MTATAHSAALTTLPPLRLTAAVAAFACVLTGLHGTVFAQAVMDATLDTVVVTGSTRERRLT